MKRFSNICQFFRCWKPVSQKLTLILLLVYHALTVLRRACAAQSKTANQIESNNKSIRILWMASKIKSKRFSSEKVSKFLLDACSVDCTIMLSNFTFKWRHFMIQINVSMSLTFLVVCKVSCNWSFVKIVKNSDQNNDIQK